MAKKKVELSEEELGLVENLRKRPQMKERIKAILELSVSEEGKIKSADEIEAKLIQEVRQLGATTMEEWGSGAEKALGEAHQRKNPGSYPSKKKS